MSALFSPDSFIVTDVVPSPNQDERKLPVDMILLHYTGMQTGEAALERLCAPESKVSSHYVVFENGRIVQCVPEEQARLACRRVVLGRRNRHQFVLDRHRDRQSRPRVRLRDFPLRQVAAVISLCRSIVTRRGPIIADRVLAHSDVAPARKQDPGEKFPWPLLFESGIGHWVRPAPLDLAGDPINPGDQGEPVHRLQRSLAGLRLRHRGDRPL